MVASLCRAALAGSGERPNRRAAGLLLPCVLAGLCIGAVMRANADDRPFLRTTHAMPSDDVDGWETSTTAVGNRQGHALSVQLEHELNATHRIEAEWGRSSRNSAPEPEQGLRLRSLWLKPSQAGWGMATKLGIEPAREGERSARRQALVVASLPMLNERLWLHANLGWQWTTASPGETRRSMLGSLAAHAVLGPHQWLYAESARSDPGRERLSQLGLRHWLRAHKLALDTGWGRQSGTAQAGHLIAINLSFFDLNF